MKSTKSKGYSDTARAEGVSRQAIWQRIQVARGKCRVCGRRVSTSTYDLCRTHGDAKAARARRRRLKMRMAS